MEKNPLYSVTSYTKPAERANKRDNLLKTLPKIYPTYKVKFEFKPTSFQTGWSNILHLTTNGDCCEYGQRIPGVWLHDRETWATTNRLHVCSAVNGEGNFCVNSGYVVRRGQWCTVEIRFLLFLCFSFNFVCLEN